MMLENRTGTPAAVEWPPDPAWAWAPYVPDARRPWDLRLAGHLYRRAAFGGSWTKLKQALRDGPARTVDRLLRPEADVRAFDRTFDAYETAAIDPDVVTADTLCEWWLRRMIQTPHPLQEKVTLCWHNHFAARNFQAKNGRLMARYVGELRLHALGRFQQLLSAVVRDPAVRLSYEVNANRKATPDLTLARALLEQFTVGPGAAAERDIRETARALSGLAVLRNRPRFLPHEHDGGPKVVLGSTGNWTEVDVVRIAATHRATAQRLSRLFYRWFVSEADEPADGLLAPLADVFSREGDIARLVETILRSNLFYSSAAYRGRVKSPLEFAVGIVVGLEGVVPTVRLASDLAALGQDLGEPPTSAGWAGGTAWINSATLVGRANLASFLLSGSGPYLTGLDPKNTAERHGYGPLAAAGSWLIDLFLQGDLPAPVERLVLQSAPRAEGDALRRLACQIVTLPEFQLA